MASPSAGGGSGGHPSPTDDEKAGSVETDLQAAYLACPVSCEAVLSAAGLARPSVVRKLHNTPVSALLECSTDAELRKFLGTSLGPQNITKLLSVIDRYRQQQNRAKELLFGRHGLYPFPGAASALEDFTIRQLIDADEQEVRMRLSFAGKKISSKGSVRGSRGRSSSKPQPPFPEGLPLLLRRVKEGALRARSSNPSPRTSSAGSSPRVSPASGTSRVKRSSSNPDVSPQSSRASRPPLSTKSRRNRSRTSAKSDRLSPGQKPKQASNSRRSRPNGLDTHLPISPEEGVLRRSTSAPASPFPTEPASAEAMGRSSRVMSARVLRRQIRVLQQKLADAERRASRTHGSKEDSKLAGLSEDKLLQLQRRLDASYRGWEHVVRQLADMQKSAKMSQGAWEDLRLSLSDSTFLQLSEKSAAADVTDALHRCGISRQSVVAAVRRAAKTETADKRWLASELGLNPKASDAFCSLPLTFRQLLAVDRPPSAEWEGALRPIVTSGQLAQLKALTVQVADAVVETSMDPVHSTVDEVLHQADVGHLTPFFLRENVDWNTLQILSRDDLCELVDRYYTQTFSPTRSSAERHPNVKTHAEAIFKLVQERRGGSAPAGREQVLLCLGIRPPAASPGTVTFGVKKRLQLLSEISALADSGNTGGSCTGRTHEVLVPFVRGPNPAARPSEFSVDASPPSADQALADARIDDTLLPFLEADDVVAATEQTDSKTDTAGCDQPALKARLSALREDTFSKHPALQDLEPGMAALLSVMGAAGAAPKLRGFSMPHLMSLTDEELRQRVCGSRGGLSPGVGDYRRLMVLRQAAQSLWKDSRTRQLAWVTARVAATEDSGHTRLGLWHRLQGQKMDDTALVLLQPHEIGGLFGSEHFNDVDRLLKAFSPSGSTVQWQSPWLHYLWRAAQLPVGDPRFGGTNPATLSIHEFANMGPQELDKLLRAAADCKQPPLGDSKKVHQLHLVVLHLQQQLVSRLVGATRGDAASSPLSSESVLQELQGIRRQLDKEFAGLATRFTVWSPPPTPFSVQSNQPGSGLAVRVPDSSHPNVGPPQQLGEGNAHVTELEMKLQSMVKLVSEAMDQITRQKADGKLPERKHSGDSPASASGPVADADKAEKDEEGAVSGHKKTLRLLWPARGLQFNMEGQTLRLGRHGQNEVQIQDPLVSGRHAVIRGGQIIDSSSTNGTFVNDQEVPKNVPWPLQNGDVLKLGDSVFHVVLSSNEDPLPATQPDAGVDLTATTPGPAASGKPDVDHQVWVLKRQVESLRAENMKMKQKLNPQRMRMARKEQQSKERELVMQVQDLEHQIYYGKEVETKDLDDARRLNRKLQGVVSRALSALRAQSDGWCADLHKELTAAMESPDLKDLGADGSSSSEEDEDQEADLPAPVPLSVSRSHTSPLSPVPEEDSDHEPEPVDPKNATQPDLRRSAHSSTASAAPSAVAPTAPAPEQGPLKLVWPDRKLQFALKRVTLRLGRNVQNDVQIPDPLVSGKHASIRHGILTDGGSTNGTLVNGTEVPKNVPWPLRAGDILKLGDTEFRVETGRPYDEFAERSSSSDSGDDSDDGGDNGPRPPIASASATGVVKPTTEQQGPVVSESPEVNHQMWVLRKHVEQLRAENLQLKSKINPQRVRQERREQREQMQELNERIQQMQHQIFYGEEQQDHVERLLTRRLHDAETELKRCKASLATAKAELVRLRGESPEPTREDGQDVPDEPADAFAYVAARAAAIAAEAHDHLNAVPADGDAANETTEGEAKEKAERKARREQREKKMTTIAGHLRQIAILEEQKTALQHSLNEAHEEIERLKQQLDDTRGSAITELSYRGIGAARPRRRPRRKRSVWLEFEEETTGVHYYYNQVTGETTWDPPPHFEKADQHYSLSSSDAESDEGDTQTGTAAAVGTQDDGPAKEGGDSTTQDEEPAMSVRFRMMELQLEDGPGEGDGSPKASASDNKVEWSQDELDQSHEQVARENSALERASEPYRLAPPCLVMNQLGSIVDGSTLVIDTRPPDQYKTGHVPHAVNVYIPPEVLQMHSTTVTLHQLTSLAISRPLLTRVQDHLKRMAADPTTSPSARDEHAPDTGPAAPEQEQHGTASDDAGFAPRILIYGASTDDHLSAAARRLLNEEDPAIQDTADHDDAKGPETVAVILARSIAAESAENTADAHNPKTLMVLRGGWSRFAEAYPALSCVYDIDEMKKARSRVRTWIDPHRHTFDDSTAWPCEIVPKLLFVSRHIVPPTSLQTLGVTHAVVCSGAQTSGPLPAGNITYERLVFDTPGRGPTALRRGYALLSSWLSSSPKASPNRLCMMEDADLGTGCSMALALYFFMRARYWSLEHCCASLRAQQIRLLMDGWLWLLLEEEEIRLHGCSTASTVELGDAVSQDLFRKGLVEARRQRQARRKAVAKPVPDAQMAVDVASHLLQSQTVSQQEVGIAVSRHMLTQLVEQARAANRLKNELSSLRLEKRQLQQELHAQNSELADVQRVLSVPPGEDAVHGAHGTPARNHRRLLTGEDVMALAANARPVAVDSVILEQADEATEAEDPAMSLDPEDSLDDLPGDSPAPSERHRRSRTGSSSLSVSSLSSDASPAPDDRD